MRLPHWGALPPHQGVWLSKACGLVRKTFRKLFTRGANITFKNCKILRGVSMSVGSGGLVIGAAAIHTGASRSLPL